LIFAFGRIYIKDFHVRFHIFANRLVGKQTRHNFINMRNITKFLIIIVSMATIMSCTEKPVSKWSDSQVQEWCSSNVFFNSLPAKPSETTDLREFARQYLANQAEWDAALAFLRDNDLQTMDLGIHQITDNGTYANVQEYTSHVGGKFECHRAYIDVQYVVSGNEITKLAPLEAAQEPFAEFNTEKDCQLFATASEPVDIKLNKDTFAIFFPHDLHAPGMADVDTCAIKKVVVKIPVATISEE